MLPSSFFFPTVIDCTRTRKIVHESPTIRESLDDLIGRPLFHRQTINDSDHAEPPRLSSLLLVGLRGR
jgi:hypothetical protein